MKASPSPTKTRELVIQALYQKTISGDSNTKVLKELRQTQKGLNTEKVGEIVKDIKSLEQKFIDTIGKFSNIPTSRIGEIELSILFLALYEICEDIRIHALSYIMPIKGDITRVKQKYNLKINPSKKIYF